MKTEKKFEKFSIWIFGDKKNSKKYFEIYEFGCSLVQLFHPLFITSWKNKKIMNTTISRALLYTCYTTYASYEPVLYTYAYL